MDIVVNDTAIDFHLEGERTAGEVVTGLRHWMGEQGYVITMISVDGHPFTSEMDVRDISRIGKMDVRAENLLEIRFERFATIHEYFSLLRSCIFEKNTDALSEVMAEYGYVRESLPDIFMEGSSGPVCVALDSLMEESGILTGGMPDREAGERLIEHIDGMIETVAERMSELSDPREALRRAIGEMKALLPTLQEVSLLLQTGQDRKAMEHILRFTELSQRLVRLYPNLRQQGIFDTEAVEIDGMSFRDFYSGFDAVLEEMNDAFLHNDSVLIGDLLEYEIAPKLEVLNSLLDAV